MHSALRTAERRELGSESREQRADLMASFGPNTSLLERFLERLAHLEFAQVATVVSVWRETLRRSDEWYAAEDDVGDAITFTRRHDEQKRLQGRLYDLFRRATWFSDAQPTAAEQATEAAAQYVASAAAFALLVVDELDPGSFATLYAPFAGIIPLADLGLDGAARSGQRGARPADLPADPHGDAGRREAHGRSHPA